MTGLCGWYLKNNHNAPDESILKSMQNKMAIPKTLHHSQAHMTTNTNSSALAVTDYIHQSIFNTQGLMVACSGHISWHHEELMTLAKREGNATVIAKLYRENGTDLLQHIHNDFCLAIIDQEKDKVILAIDRMGIQRLCFQQVNDSVVFASDIQAIFSSSITEKELSDQGIYNYFYFHMVPSPGSIYKNVEKLLPGQRIIFSKGKLDKKFYWHTPYQDNNSASFEQLNTDFHKILRKSVQSRMDQTEIGAFLSGGLDSSTVSGILSELSDSSAKTFSIGFDAKGYDETPFARIVARHFKTDHHEYYVTPRDVVDAVPLIAQFYDEPFGNASAIPAYFCAKFAKEQGIKTMLGGDGGDEIFAGNERYVKQQIFEHYLTLPETLRTRIIEPVFSILPGRNTLPLLRKANSYIQQARIPLPARLEGYNFLNRTPLEQIFNRDFLSSVDPHWPLEMLNEAYDRTDSDDTLHKMLHLDMKVTIADNDIRKVNKMCALAGVDVVYPFLDDEMVNFAAAIPPQLKIKHGKLRYFFKKATSGFLPDETINKQKHGFGLPFGIWMKEYKPLHELARESLSSLEQRGYFNKDYIENLWQLHEKEHSSYYGVMIWVMMMFEQWLTLKK